MIDITAILLTLTVLVLAAAYILNPFLKTGKRISRSEAGGINSLDHQRSSLLAEKERLLNAVNELDFDNELGKVPEDLYPVQRAELIQKAAGVLRDLEAFGEAPEEAGKSSKTANKAGNGDYDELEAQIAKRRSEANGKSRIFCPGCGKPVQPADKFCPKCGKTINPETKGGRA